MPKVNNKALLLSRQASEKRRSSGEAAGILVGTVAGSPFIDDTTQVPVREIPLTQIKERDVNAFELTNIPQLAESISQYGLIDPISVIHKSGTGDEYIIVSGHRRFKAYQTLNEADPENRAYQVIPCCVYELTDNPEELEQGLPYIDSKQEEEMYLDANLQSRQLKYGEVARNVRHIIDRFEDEDYFLRINSYANTSERYSIGRGSKVNMVINLLSSYSYKGWQRETVRRYLKLYEAVKEGEIPESVLDSIEKEEYTVKVAYDKYIATKTNNHKTIVGKDILGIKRYIIDIEKQDGFLTTQDRNEIKQCIDKLKSFLEK